MLFFVFFNIIADQNKQTITAMNAPIGTIPTSFVLIPEERLKAIENAIYNINANFKPSSPSNNNMDGYITAQEFMDSCRIGRSKFDDLRSLNLINCVKKGRKIYLKKSEIQRYFENT
ncbi:MAG: hypothetical protein SFY32_16700 [Bacteroidota bacterium]|nr:hypothetical protein [Bacteroidota bacterium]